MDGCAIQYWTADVAGKISGLQDDINVDAMVRILRANGCRRHAAASIAAIQVGAISLNV